MKVAQLSFFRDRRRRPADILRDWWVLVDCAEMVAATGASVTVFQACRESASIEQNGVLYHFIAPELGTGLMGGSRKLARLLRGLQPDILHVNGLAFPADTRQLARILPETPIFLQDHADRVPRWWRRAAMRRGLAAAAGVSFCSLEQAIPFREAGLLNARTRVFEIPESATRFMPGDREDARRLTGMHGDPAVLWVGHLDRNKDPVTVLTGLAQAARTLPGMQVWCCFGTAPLLGEVQTLMAQPALRDRVHLLGRVDHPRVERLMRAADIFVLGSRREGSGCSLVEALACGLPPVVTDIPSFRTMTGDGVAGELWPCGEADAMCAALLRVAACPREELRRVVRAHFERELSPAAVGRKIRDAYESVMRCEVGRGRLPCSSPT
jgi:glycosyltransferase involved in cell wall biosynthesis